MTRWWRAWLASLLLVAGVAGVGATAETGAIGWAVLGYLMLLFVPPLIVEAVLHALKTYDDQ